MIGACRIFRSDTETIGYQRWRSASQVRERSAAGPHGSVPASRPLLASANPRSTTTTTTTTAGGTRVAEYSGLPPTSEMLGWIDEVVAQGIRRPGYPADRWAEEFIFDKFEHLGLQSVLFESVEAALWQDSHARLSVVTWQQTTEFECFPVPMSEPTGV